MQIVLMAITLSIDALGIGISYGLKGVHISLSSKLVIGLISAFIMGCSLAFGELLNTLFPKDIMNIMGCGILILMGVIFIRNSLFSKEGCYDLDHSSKIEGFEAVLLGIALSADSVSAGIAASVLQIGGIFLPILVGCMQMIFLSISEFIMKHCYFATKINHRFCGVFSGGIFLMIAFLRML